MEPTEKVLGSIPNVHNLDARGQPAPSWHASVFTLVIDKVIPLGESCWGQQRCCHGNIRNQCQAVTNLVVGERGTLGHSGPVSHTKSMGIVGKLHFSTLYYGVYIQYINNNTFMHTTRTNAVPRFSPFVRPGQWECRATSRRLHRPTLWGGFS